LPPDGALAIARDASSFITPSGGRVDLARRAPLRLILGHLAERRHFEPGSVVSTEALFAVGWLGEKAGLAAIKNRVRVAISTLRDLGLRNAIETSPMGYRIAPSVLVCAVKPREQI
jgi:hypothetical protein